MSAIATSQNFINASLSLQDFLDQLGQDMSDLRQSSFELYQNFKNRLSQNWEDWPQIIKAYQLELATLPKDIRKRDFYQKMMADIQILDQEVKAYLNQLNTTSVSEIKQTIHQHLTETSLSIESHIAHLKNHMAHLEDHAVVQKFLRDEPILATKKSVQWNRKIGHALFGLSFFYLFILSGWPAALIWSITLPFVAACFALETARHFNPRVNQWVCRYFKPVMRESEKTKINSSMFYMTGMLIVYFVFPKEIAGLTMLFLALGDPIAGTVGFYWGKTKISKHTSLEGSLACFGTCALVTALSAPYLFEIALSLKALVVFSICAGLIGAVSESAFRKIDDNLVIPLISAPGLWGLSKIFALL